MAFSIMAKVKHSFNAASKHCLLDCQSNVMHHKAMLKIDSEADRLAMALRLRGVLTGPGIKSTVANQCGVTEQAVTGWLKTGRIHKKHLPVIAKLRDVNLNWLLTGQEPMRSDGAHAEAAREETEKNGEHAPLSPQIIAAATALLSRTSPDSQKKLKDILHKAQMGYINERDIDTLHQIAQRLAEKGKSE
jgi:hypothetical protein